MARAAVLGAYRRSLPSAADNRAQIRIGGDRQIREGGSGGGGSGGEVIDCGRSGSGQGRAVRI